MMSRAAVVRRFALRNHTDPSALRQPFAVSSCTGKMSAKELSKALSEQMEFLNQSKSEEVVKALFGLIKKSMKEGKRVSIPRFGIFDTFTAKAMTRDNPITKKAVLTPAKERARFSASSILKKELNSEELNGEE